VVDAMADDGYWVEPGPGYNPKYRSTVWALILLAHWAHRPRRRASGACRAFSTML
jgi:hypothetical protein